MDQPPQEQKQSGVDLMDLIMYPVQIVGMAIVIFLLKRFTPLPFWACMIIGIPSFFAFFWGALYLFFGRGDRSPPKRRRRSMRR
jgi:hypothetical protein